MMANTEIKRLFHKLKYQFSAKIHFFGSDIAINFLDHSSKVQLSTPVYVGTNYIPKSVRDCLSQKSPFADSGINTHFSLDEDNYRIVLIYTGSISHLEDYLFEDLLEKFGRLANEWRSLLDEKDKNDLVYIHAR